MSRFIGSLFVILGLCLLPALGVGIPIILLGLCYMAQDAK